MMNEHLEFRFPTANPPGKWDDYVTAFCFERDATPFSLSVEAQRRG